MCSDPKKLKNWECHGYLFIIILQKPSTTEKKNILIFKQCSVSIMARQSVGKCSFFPDMRQRRVHMCWSEIPSAGVWASAWSAIRSVWGGKSLGETWALLCDFSCLGVWSTAQHTQPGCECAPAEKPWSWYEDQVFFLFCFFVWAVVPNWRSVSKMRKKMTLWTFLVLSVGVQTS